MKEIVEKYKFEIPAETVDYIDEFEDPELAHRIYKILDTFAQVAGLETEINEKENNDGQGDTEADQGDKRENP